MRVHIRHEITQLFDPRTRNTAVALRLTPRPYEGQFIQRWTLDLDNDCRLHPQEDAFGNLCHTFSVDGPTDRITVIAEGEVETLDTTGIVRGTVERFPPALYLRQTETTTPNEAIITLANELDAPAGDPLARLHALMVKVHEAVREADGPLDGDPFTAEAALEAKTACSAGITHLFTASARLLGLPARHIAGYLALEEEGTARHWAEAYVPKIGWVAFDAGRNICATEHYVRLSVGLDAIAVAALRATGLRQQEVVSAQEGRPQRRSWYSQAQAQAQGQN